MNIFYLHSDPEECARWHVDRHVVKMILEYSQLLSTTHRVLDGSELKLVDDREHLLYKASHINHPSAVWVRKSSNNYFWLLELLMALHEEYTHRYEKFHKSFDLTWGLLVEPDNISNDKFSEPPQCMPDQYKIVDNTIESYRKYYREGKSHLAAWKNRLPPPWYYQGE